MFFCHWIVLLISRLGFTLFDTIALLWSIGRLLAFFRRWGPSKLQHIDTLFFSQPCPGGFRATFKKLSSGCPSLCLLPSSWSVYSLVCYFFKCCFCRSLLWVTVFSKILLSQLEVRWKSDNVSLVLSSSLAEHLVDDDAPKIDHFSTLSSYSHFKASMSQDRMMMTMMALRTTTVTIKTISMVRGDKKI